MPSPLNQLHRVVAVATREETLLEAKEELISPALAMSWLERGGKNRPIDYSHVRRLAQDMRDGNWRRSGEPIHMNDQGQIVNGQHRLWAIAECGLSIYLMVVRGVSDDAFDVFDTGKKRTANDVLALSGYQNARALSAAARNLMNFERAGSPISSGRAPISNAQIKHFVESNQMLNEWAHEGVRMERAGLGGRGTWTAILYMLAQLDADQTRHFMDLLISGANLSAGNPILALRNRIGRARERIDHAELMCLSFKAWNAWRHGSEIKLLAWRRTGDTREDIPRPE